MFAHQFALFTLVLAACVPPSPATDESVTLHIMAINDFHGALYETTTDDPDVVLGGLPWLASAINDVRDRHPDALLFDGGDLFQGTWPVNATSGRGAVEAFNLLGVDAAAIGNHEFDYGPLKGGDQGLRGSLLAAAAVARFDWLASNISIVSDHGEERPWHPQGIKPWSLIERQGVKIGVIGVTTSETPSVTLAAHVADLRFANPAKTVAALMPDLERAGVDVVVVVGHLTGHCEPVAFNLPPDGTCRPDGEIGELIALGTVDVIVSGHSHTLLANRVDDTFVLQGRSLGRILNQISLVIDADGVNPNASQLHPPMSLAHEPTEPGCEGGSYDITPQTIAGRTLTPDVNAISLIRALEGDAGSLCDPVACTNDRITRAQDGETALGDLVSTAVKTAFLGADFAIQNAGGLRADLPAGTIRRENIHAVSPFDNRLLLVEMTGAAVQTLFRIGASSSHGSLQVGGASYHYDDKITAGTDLDGDGTISAWEIDRLCSVAVGGTPLDLTATYKVVVTDFLFGGGDHLGPAFADAKVLQEGPLLRDHLIETLSRHPTCLDIEPIIDPSWPRVTIAPCEDRR